MISIQMIDQIQVIAFWLVFTRWVVILMQLPIFDHTSIPVPVKVLSSLLISYAFYGQVEAQMIAEVKSVGVESFWLLTIFHASVGLIIGFLVKIIMSIFISSGALMTQQIGFTSVSYFDPNFVTRTGPFERIIQWTILIMILSSGALLPMFKGVIHSFHSITWASMGKFSFSHIFYMNFFKSLFATALLLAGPILFTNLMLNRQFSNS